MEPHAHPTKVVVIGAGQAGLSVGYHLARMGLEPGRELMITDRGPGTGGAWQHRWRALRLGDAHRIFDLPGMAQTGLSFTTAPHGEPARDVVARYYAAYEEFYGLRVLRPATVTSVKRGDQRHPGRFLVSIDTDGGPRLYSADAVANASGTWHRPRIPMVAGRDIFTGRQVTTPEYTDAHEFSHQRVAVVGAGTSALGFLDELTNVGATTFWFTRRAPQFIENGPDLGPQRGLAAVQRQDAAARAGRPLPSIVGTTGLPLTGRVRRLEARGALIRHPMFARLVTDGVVTAAGEHVALDAIIWATGFDAELDHLDQLALDRTRGGIVVKDGESADVPGLFLAGYGPQASTIGASRAGRAMAREIMSRLGP